MNGFYFIIYFVVTLWPTLGYNLDIRDNIFANDSNIDSVLSPVLNANSSQRLTYALLSERTVSSEYKFSKVPEILLNISSVLTESDELSMNDAFLVLQNFIKAGATGFVIDLEYNEDANDWVVHNQNSYMTFGFILQILNSFSVSKINLSNLRITHVLLNIVDKDNLDDLEHKIQLIQKSIINSLNTERILTANTVKAYEGWPNPQQIILYEYKQFIFHYTNVETDSTSYVMSAKDIDIINDNSSTYQCPLKVGNSSKTLTYKNSEEFTPKSISEAIFCGYKVIISNPFEKFDETIQALNSSLVWGWGKNEPVSVGINFGEYEGFSSSFGGGYYMGCANLNVSMLFDAESNKTAVDVNTYLWWNVSNCFESKHALCKYPDNYDDWYISENHVDFFNLRSNSISNSVDIGCPNGTFFAIPETPQEMLSVYHSLRKEENRTLIDVIKKEGIWIKLNSISLSTCWVVGDSKTVCPYQQFINKRNFFKMVLPLIVSGGCLILAIFLLKFRRLPVQNDNKQWRKFTKDFINKGDPDGVPY